MAIVRLALASLWNRRVTAGLTVLAIALSVTLLLGVEKLRRDARNTFANTISGTDLIVGARSGAVQLLLYSVFRIGDATNNISWQSYQEIAASPDVRWTVPLSLGDSHRGFRVLGTAPEYFEHYRYRDKRRLELAKGKEFEGIFDAVLGAQVARDLQYELDDKIVLAHGAGEVSFTEHADKPFVVTGILAPTGTAVDRTIHIRLAGVEALHVDWKDGRPRRGFRISAEEVAQMDLQPTSITAFLVGLESKTAIFRAQRTIGQYRAEPLLAIIPGIALQELWDLMAVAEDALRVVSIMVVVTGLLGMLTVIWSSLEARRREMAVLRSVGARGLHIFGLFVSEAGLLALLGLVCGITFLYGAILAAAPFAEREFGLAIAFTGLDASDYALLGYIFAAALCAGCVPALRAYRVSLADGLSVRI
ncbi:MAG: ABC transporter permease [Gammaproteobacteria bacterium]|nr:ABC transporter permease [Gammaproteobacteria bacterium]